MSKYQIKTNKGYDFFEVSSAFQKSVRRGDENEALYWAVELYSSNFGEYLWKRIKIITSEDIGLAEPNMPATIAALYEFYKEQAKKTKANEDKNAPERLFIVHAVLLLCRAEKSRLVDWTLIAKFGEHPHLQKAIPDFAFDKHNEQGRRMKRGWAHFFEEGTHLENHSPQPGEEEAKEAAKKIIVNPNPNQQQVFD